MGAIKDALPRDKWTPDKKAGGMLSTTNVNGFIVCLRKIIETGAVHKFEYYKRKLVGLDRFKFDGYHSSQYGRMGDELYKNYFS
jgi:hypothetical protein